MESQSTTMKPLLQPTSMILSKSASEPTTEAPSPSTQTGKTAQKQDMNSGAPLLRSAAVMQQENELEPREKRQIRISRAVASQWGQFIDRANKHLAKSLVIGS